MDSRKGLSEKASIYTTGKKRKKKSCVSNTNKFVLHPRRKESIICLTIFWEMPWPQTSLFFCPLVFPFGRSVQCVGGTPLLCFVNSVCEWQLVLLGCEQPVIWQGLAETPTQKANLFPAPSLQGFNEVLWRSSSYQRFIKDEDILTQLLIALTH